MNKRMFNSLIAVISRRW